MLFPAQALLVSAIEYFCNTDIWWCHFLLGSGSGVCAKGGRQQLETGIVDWGVGLSVFGCQQTYWNICTIIISLYFKFLINMLDHILSPGCLAAFLYLNLCQFWGQRVIFHGALIWAALQYEYILCTNPSRTQSWIWQLIMHSDVLISNGNHHVQLDSSWHLFSCLTYGMDTLAIAVQHHIVSASFCISLICFQSSDNRTYCLHAA